MVLTEAVREVATAKRRQQPAHPSAEDLIAYQEQQLPGADAARVREHLVICPECAQLVLDLSTFPDVPLRDTAMALSPEEDEEDFEALLELLPQERVAAIPLQDHKPSSKRRPVLMMAASFIVGILGLSLWLGGIRSPLQSAPDVRTGALLDLYPIASNSRGIDRAEKVEIPEDDSDLVLVLNTSDVGGFLAYQVEIRSAAKLMLQVTDLKPGTQGTITLVVPRAALPADSYEVLLFGTLEGADKTHIAVYQIEVTYNARP